MTSSRNSSLEKDGFSTSQPRTALHGAGGEAAVSAPSSVPACLYCGETDISPNVECWEMYDALICDDCADQAHDDNSQFGVGA